MGAEGSTRWGALQVRPGSRRCLEPPTVALAAETTTCPSADRCALGLGRTRSSTSLYYNK